MNIFLTAMIFIVCNLIFVESRSCERTDVVVSPEKKRVRAQKKERYKIQKQQHALLFGEHLQPHLEIKKNGMSITVELSNVETLAEDIVAKFDMLLKQVSITLPTGIFVVREKSRLPLFPCVSAEFCYKKRKRKRQAHVQKPIKDYINWIDATTSYHRALKTMTVVLPLSTTPCTLRPEKLR